MDSRSTELLPMPTGVEQGKVFSSAFDRTVVEKQFKNSHFPYLSLRSKSVTRTSKMSLTENNTLIKMRHFSVVFNHCVDGIIADLKDLNFFSDFLSAFFFLLLLPRSNGFENQSRSSQ